MRFSFGSYQLDLKFGKLDPFTSLKKWREKKVAQRIVLKSINCCNWFISTVSSCFRGHYVSLGTLLMGHSEVINRHGNMNVGSFKYRGARAWNSTPVTCQHLLKVTFVLLCPAFLSLWSWNLMPPQPHSCKPYTYWALPKWILKFWLHENKQKTLYSTNHPWPHILSNYFILFMIMKQHCTESPID